MGHIALYREWRPKTFEEVVEQKYTVLALKQAVISDSIAHAYLFSGTRGTGKTTMAQVFSRAINCLAPENGNPCNKCKVCLGILDNTILDVIEMDAASNNNVDTIRRLCDEIVFSPSIARFKVYIIDEVHMLSTGAFNALLKTLEEPPSHAVFILATTEQHRIPATILSRCQRYEFRRITAASIVERLLKICEEDKINASDEALRTISKLADGALRDAISLLDQARSAFPDNITKENVLSLVGLVNDEFMFSLATAICDNAPDKGLELVEELILEGRDIIKFTGDLALYFRNVMLCHVCKEPDSLINYPTETIDGMRQIASKMPLSRVIAIIKELSSLVSDLRWSSNPRITFEIALIKIMDFQDSVIDSKLEDSKVSTVVNEVSLKTVSPDKESSSAHNDPVNSENSLKSVKNTENQNAKAAVQISNSQEKSVIAQDNSQSSKDDVENKPDKFTNDRKTNLTLDGEIISNIQGNIEKTNLKSEENLSNSLVDNSGSNQNVSNESGILKDSNNSADSNSLVEYSDSNESSEPSDNSVADSLPDDEGFDPFFNEVPFDESDEKIDEDAGEPDNTNAVDPFSSESQKIPMEITEDNTKSKKPGEFDSKKTSDASITDENILDNKTSEKIIPEDAKSAEMPSNPSKSTEVTDLNLPEVSIFWPKLLDKLMSTGQMTLYLFMLPAKPSFKEDKLVINFEDADEYNCKEVSTDPNVRIISDLIYSMLDQRLKIVVKLVSEEIDKGKNPTKTLETSSSDENKDNLSDGVSALKRSAEELGISFYMEE